MKAPFTRDELHAIPGEDLEALADNASELWAELRAGFYAGDPDEDRRRFWAAQILGEQARRWQEEARAKRQTEPVFVPDDAPF